MDVAARIINSSIPEPNSGCMLWLAGMNGNYPLICFGGEWKYAHRVSFEVFVRPLRDSELVCHRCDVTSCVNPDHLFAGSYLDNQHDCMAKGRWTHGEKHGMAQLTVDDVIEIRQFFANGASASDLASRYDVCAAHIRKIVSGRIWRHTPGDLTVNRRSDTILDFQKAEEIRELLKGSTPRKDIARQYGVSVPTVYAIGYGKIHKRPKTLAQASLS